METGGYDYCKIDECDCNKFISQNKSEQNMKTRKDIVEEIEGLRKNLRKENAEKSITNLIELLYGKLSDEDVRILEISMLKRMLEGFDIGLNQRKDKPKGDKK